MPLANQEQCYLRRLLPGSQKSVGECVQERQRAVNIQRTLGAVRDQLSNFGLEPGRKMDEQPFKVLPSTLCT